MENEVKEFDCHSFDAKVWANEFCRMFPNMEKETMLGWFANAIMAGYDYKDNEKRIFKGRRIPDRENFLFDDIKEGDYWFNRKCEMWFAACPAKFPTKEFDLVIANLAGGLNVFGATVFDITKNIGSNTKVWTDLINGVLANGIYDFYVDFWYTGKYHFKEKFTICITKDPEEKLSYDIMSNGNVSSITTGTGADFGKINLTLTTEAMVVTVRYIKWA